MANDFKQKQDAARREKLLAECKAQIALGAVGRRRAVEAYAKAAAVSTAQAEAVLGLR
ncbi:hypothetical protein [Janthinobacterium sp. NKUCC06_STL]|jgi:hypothetical protein|uniref:hypothetical protein n=1 Tax=Janthinobacterium sp. NKUCC06_STL TaxID=2842127 RepID=UPI001C5A5E47|nr:hypothetical protein [Janthinobacterium sp. NKUCC06_STL]MBW3512176.1 hypothetical protein [Janthinobacterium sp. NKUCC06_STL]